MRRFLIKEDVIIFSQQIFHKDETIEVGECIDVDKNGVKFTIPLSEILNDSRFQELQELNSNISEVSEDEEEIKNYRIQLDVKTSKRKIIEIERFLRKSLDEIL